MRRRGLIGVRSRFDVPIIAPRPGGVRKFGPRAPRPVCHETFVALRCDKCYTYGRTLMAKPNPERLSRRERQIMNALFALGNRASAEDIRGRLTSPPSYSSVRVTLARLETKGFVKHQDDGVRYIYSATISPAAANRAALQQYLQTF